MPKPQTDRWPKKVRLGWVTVPVYRCRRPDGQWSYRVANRADGRRRWETFKTEVEALTRAQELARLLADRQVDAAAIPRQQAVQYRAAEAALAPFGVDVAAAAHCVADCLRLVGDLQALREAARTYALHHRSVQAKPLREAVAEFLALKESQGASARTIQDLKARLGRFCAEFADRAVKDISTADVQRWLDGLHVAPRTYSHYRRVVHTFYRWAVNRAYAAANPAAPIAIPKAPPPPVPIYSPEELAKLFAAAPPDYVPCLAIGAFAGLRSAEIERLQWSDIRLDRREIVVGADRAKTATRRIVPICDALAAWLAPYAGRQGPVWPGNHEAYYVTQRRTAAAAGLKWKPNALRHSYASYRFALIRDAGRVAGELGNSPAVVHRHYRELVSAADAERWFATGPEQPANVVQLTNRPLA